LTHASAVGEGRDIVTGKPNIKGNNDDDDAVHDDIGAAHMPDDEVDPIGANWMDNIMYASIPNHASIPASHSRCASVHQRDMPAPPG
jgi:hypothetical protein